jgi:hypothetical protein
MSLLSSAFGARRHKHDLVPMAEERDAESRRDVLIPPRAEDLDRVHAPTRFERIAGLDDARLEDLAAAISRPAAAAPPPVSPTPAAVSAPPARSRQPVQMTDISRLSIDANGRLYWDGKPAEVRHRLAMSPRQVAGASLLGLFIIIGGIAAAIQGTISAHDWSCRVGWVRSYCPAAPALRAPARADIPA